MFYYDNILSSQTHQRQTKMLFVTNRWAIYGCTWTSLYDI